MKFPEFSQLAGNLAIRDEFACELRFREGSVERSAETTRDDPDGEYLKRNRWFESGSLHR